MQAAPAVSHVCRDDPVWRMGGLALGALAGSCLAGWLAAWGSHVAGAGAPWFVPLAALSGGAAALLAGRSRPAPDRMLSWTGSSWQLADAEGTVRSGQARVVLDLQTWMLLRFDGRDRSAPAWLPVRSRREGAADTALRAALYAGAPSADGAAGPDTP